MRTSASTGAPAGGMEILPLSRLPRLLAVLVFVLIPDVSRGQWITDGAPVCAASGYQSPPAIAPDGSGGVIITWYDGRSSSTDADIYAQRLNSAGEPLWTVDGKVVCGEDAHQFDPVIVSDGAGGAVIAWYDERNPGGVIYAQRIDADGDTQWDPAGVALGTSDGSQLFPRIVSEEGDQLAMELTSDGVGGAIAVWEDYRNSSQNLHIRRVTASGTAQWTANGTALCTAPGGQYSPAITSDGSGGAIVAWEDGRAGAQDSTSSG